MHRLERIHAHLHFSVPVVSSSAEPHDASRSSGTLRPTPVDSQKSRPIEGTKSQLSPADEAKRREMSDALSRKKNFQMFMSMIEDKGSNWQEMDTAPLLKLDGPHRLPGATTRLDYLERSNDQRRAGRNLLELEQLAVEFTGDSAANLVLPSVIFEDLPVLGDMVVIGNEKDAERVARVHLVKSKVYANTFLGEGVLSTRNLDSWREQRMDLAEAFLPFASLAKIMPVSVARAKYLINEKLPAVADKGEAFNWYPIMLHEAMAQLHLALFGEKAEFSEAHNVNLRNSFDAELSGIQNPTNMEEMKKARRYIQSFATEVLSHSATPTGKPTWTAPLRAEALGCPVVGPLGAKMAENMPRSALDPLAVRRDTTTTFSFAGFDTTANLMTWFTFEMSRRPELQKRLHAEIDRVFDEIEKEGRELQYEDLPKLEFMTKCILETLRVWPSVPNGTFRELTMDEEICGTKPGDPPVALPKGTQVWIPVWPLHRSKRLWGPDAHLFNPDREFLPEESFYGRSFGGQNPQSHRYCPFTFPPRGCIGLNFAQMEARVILSHVYRKYSFELAGESAERAPTAQTMENFLGFNQGTMGPENGLMVRAKLRR